MKPLSQEPLEIIVTGVGGQGNVLASQVLGRAFLKAGYRVVVGETFGLSQRGGVVMSMVRVVNPDSPLPELGPLVPEHRASVVLSLEPLEALRLLPVYGHPQVAVITNDRPLIPLNVASGANKYPDLETLRQAIAELSGRLCWLPASQEAFNLGNPILANVILLGALAASGLIPLGPPQLEDTLAEMFPESKMPANRQALAKGAALV